LLFENRLILLHCFLLILALIWYYTTGKISPFCL
jgi:hypothetical protein